MVHRDPALAVRPDPYPATHGPDRPDGPHRAHVLGRPSAAGCGRHPRRRQPIVRPAGTRRATSGAPCLHCVDAQMVLAVRTPGHDPGASSGTATCARLTTPTSRRSARAGRRTRRRCVPGWPRSPRPDLDRSATSFIAAQPQPLGRFLTHVVLHAAHQQADAATLLSAAGASPGEIEFLDWVLGPRCLARRPAGRRRLTVRPTG